MPALRLGNNQNIVYLSNTSDEGRGSSGGGLFFLKRYDVQTKASSIILNLHGDTFETAQLSLDGQWVLFTSLINSTSQIQLVRIDGQYLQTLYCAPSGLEVDPTHTTGMQWSPDQKQIIFNQGASASATQSVYLLQLSNGTLQRVLAPSASIFSQYIPRTWLDNQRVYITDNSATISNVRLLDTRKGADQNADTLPHIIGPHDSIIDFDSSYDASKFFLSTYLQGNISQCEIYINNTINTKNLGVINCNKLPVLGMRVIGRDSASLLLVVYNQNSYTDPNNGMWKINTNGTGLTHLSKVNGLFPVDAFCSFTQYPWSNFSRDGSFYSGATSFGSLNGGPMTPYTTNSNMRTVGWTTM